MPFPGIADAAILVLQHNLKSPPNLLPSLPPNKKPRETILQFLPPFNNGSTPDGYCYHVFIVMHLLFNFS